MVFIHFHREGAWIGSWLDIGEEVGMEVSEDGEILSAGINGEVVGEVVSSIRMLVGDWCRVGKKELSRQFVAGLE